MPYCQIFVCAQFKSTVCTINLGHPVSVNKNWFVTCTAACSNNLSPLLYVHIGDNQLIKIQLGLTLQDLYGNLMCLTYQIYIYLIYINK